MPAITTPRAGERRAEENRSRHNSRTAERMRRDGVRRTTTRCPICTQQVGVGQELIDHLDAGCPSS